ncbi:MAG: hypothetical protein A2007_03555 [Verrucomicrobia bacterium GWC2_42_7]|nr:MAG: hypothetical protein A2007_03555 [Verrucomicrobia bacterium GWC2_42_7]
MSFSGPFFDKNKIYLKRKIFTTCSFFQYLAQKKNFSKFSFAQKTPFRKGAWGKLLLGDQKQFSPITTKNNEKPYNI